MLGPARVQGPVKRVPGSYLGQMLAILDFIPLLKSSFNSLIALTGFSLLLWARFRRVWAGAFRSGSASLAECALCQVVFCCAPLGTALCSGRSLLNMP